MLVTCVMNLSSQVSVMSQMLTRANHLALCLNTTPHLTLGAARHDAPTARVGKCKVHFIRILTVSGGPGQLQITIVRQLSICASVMGISP